MLVLGVTSKDKGTQLEGLVHADLKGRGFVNTHTNLIGPGGNELDVVGESHVNVTGATHVTPVLCEAKAYKDPVDMPTWQKFLGKLLLERADNPRTLGMLIALNGVNGNVRGNHTWLSDKDDGVFVIDGIQLLSQAEVLGQVAPEAAVRATVTAQFGRSPSSIESAYYGGGYFWVVRWNDEEYSVVDGHGSALAGDEIESLREALEACIAGVLLPVDEAQTRTEARHDAKAAYINRLFRGDHVAIDDDSATEDEKAAFASLSDEPYCRADGGRLVLLSAGELDAAAVCRLFNSLFESRVAVRHLEFMADSHHDHFVQRLIDVLPDIQAGFSLSADDDLVLRQIAPLFPSVWVLLAQPIQMITTHRASSPELTEDESIYLADRNEFWDAVIGCVRQDFTNVFLRGFLYDYMGVAELEQSDELIVKSKVGVIGTMRTTTRTSIGQLSDELVGEAGTRHVLVRALPTIHQPWEGEHPDPVPLPASGNEGDQVVAEAETRRAGAPLLEAE